ncbi:MAG: cytidine deaminase [Actinomycetota bacterium]|nr:cytidine deaminase [Actinomycetota bacterium]MDP9461966.1 cytidine deaminase [Actinomycetota bacterium]
MDVDQQHELVAAARQLLRPHRVGDRLFGDVAAVVTSSEGHRFGGVCLDTASGTGFCAEQAAAAAMVTAGQYRIASVVAVSQDEEGALYVLPPCGSCREFLRQLDPANLDATVLLGHGRALRLRDLLPEHEWPQPEAATPPHPR